MERWFIHSENQTILWFLIHKNPYWKEFSRVYPGKQAEWFRQCMGQMFDRIVQANAEANAEANAHLTLDGMSKKAWILERNKEALFFMSEDLRRLLGHATNEPSLNSIHPNLTNIDSTPIESLGKEIVQEHSYSMATGLIPTGLIPTEPIRIDSLKESSQLAPTAPRTYDKPPISAFDVEAEKKAKREQAEREFEQYQNQYNGLLKRNVPTAPVFSEHLTDEKILNMDELLQQQIAMRERDVSMVSLPSVVPPTSTSSILKPTTIQIGEPLDSSEFVSDVLKNEIIEIIDRASIESLPTLEPGRTSAPKKVEWSMAEPEYH